LNEANKAIDSRDAADRVLDALSDLARLDSLSASDWLNPEEIGRMEQACYTWAASDDFVSLFAEPPLLAAAQLNWPRVIEILEGNPCFIPAHLSSIEGLENCYSPGKLALLLSKFGWSNLGVRFAANSLTRRNVPVSELSVQKFVKIAGTENAEMLGHWEQVLITHRQCDAFAAAIAWKRYRIRRSSAPVNLR
jgi:hypothetical protein